MRQFKLILSIILLISLLATSVKSETLREIKITGNERISNDTIILFSGLKEISKISDEIINNSLKNLYETNFFENVSINYIDGKILIIVKEFPIIESINIDGIKAKRIKESIFKNLNLKSRSSFNKILLQADKELILNNLKRLGYYFSKIDIFVSNLKDNKVNVTYKVDLGSKAKIKKITFIGDKRFKDKKLKSLIVSEEYKFWKLVSGKKYLSEDLIKLDERLIKNFYLNKGYYNVEVNSSFGKLINDDEFELIFNINSNERIFFGNLNITIPNDFEKKNYDDINNLFSKIKGEPYSINTVEKILDQINILTTRMEFQSVKSTVNESFELNYINLDFIIEETEKVIIEKINIFGNNITRENVIRNQFEVDEGDPYNEILFKLSENNIKSLNFFKNVNSEIIDGTNPNLKIINISVEEKPTGEIFAGAGIGTNGGSIAFGIKENNYLGKGLALETNVSISEESLKGNIDVFNPNYNNSDKSLNFNLQAIEIDRTSTSGYKTNKTGFGVGTKFEYLSNLNLGLSTNTTIEKIVTDAAASTKQKNQAGNYLDSFLNLDFDYDKRNQKFKTTDGFRSAFITNIPVISDTNTLTNTYVYNYYTELYENNISNIGLFLKSANSISDNDIKLSERLYIPASKLRGFEKGKVGPKDGNDFVGGNYISSLNFTTNVPQVFENLQSLDILFFVDVANIWGVDYSSTLNDSNEIRSSVGIALDWLTPIGPLSFSFAEAITKGTNDITETFRFNLGTSF
jgi:outer membrane protein insertion porin family